VGIPWASLLKDKQEQEDGKLSNKLVLTLRDAGSTLEILWPRLSATKGIGN